LSGDRDSLSSDNYFMVLALDRLGRREEADRLEKRFEEFARSQLNSRPAPRRAEASYLLGLVAKRAGNRGEAGKRMQEAVKALPDFLPARLELRSDVLDPIEAGQ
jgi:tetratricopeptide (TPR) repeat protein